MAMSGTMNTLLVFVILLPQLLLICGHALTKGAPTVRSRNFYPKYRHEMFYDDKMIPEDIEVDVPLHKSHTRKLFFVLDSGYAPLWVTVTPCSTDAVLEWKISHSVFPGPDASYRQNTWPNHVSLPGSSPSAAYKGRDRSSYIRSNAPPGTYTVELRSSGEASAQVVVTTRSAAELPFHPPLPPDPSIQILKVKRNRILISWESTLSTRPSQYCVSSNTWGNYNSLCTALRDIHASKHGASLTCLGRKTWHLFKNLRGGRRYYFDAFVLDEATNASSAYVGVSVGLSANLRNGGPPVPRIKDGTLVSFSLDESNGYGINAKYHQGKSSGPVLVFVQSCKGPGPVNLHVTRNGSEKQNLMSTTVMDTKTLQLPPTNISSLGFSLRSTTSHPRKVRLWVSSRRQTNPFPARPEDKRIRVFETLTTCDSITIGWITTAEERVKYCIYKRIGDNIQAEPQNFCESKSQGDLVLCRRYHRFSKRRFNNIIMQKVKNLNPNTIYVFEVQVTKVKGEMLPYEQVWARTLDTCSKNRR